MKKTMIFVSALVITAMGAMFVACNSNNPTNGCKCTISYKGESEVETVSLRDMKDMGWTQCSQVEKWLKEEEWSTFPGSISCKAY